MDAEARWAQARLRVFCHFAEPDRVHRQALERSLWPLIDAGRLAYWDRSHVAYGEEHEPLFDKYLTEAHVILWLLSPDALADERSGPRLIQMRERQRQGALVVPILVRSCLWQPGPLGHIPPLPRNGRPIDTAGNEDRAWQRVVEELLRRILVHGLRHAEALPSGWLGTLVGAALRRRWRWLAPLVMLLGLLSALLLGESTQRARALLLGLAPENFSYGPLDLLRTGLHLAPHLLWRALYSPWLGVGPERWAPLVLVSWLLLGGLLHRRWPRLALGWFALSLPAVLLRGLLPLMAALGVQGGLPLPQTARPPATGTSDWALIATAVYRWMSNEGLLNELQRQALAGTHVWAVLTAMLTATIVLRGRGGGAWRRALGLTYAALAVILLRLAPNSYALSQWGVSYPRVLSIESSCGGELTELLTVGRCQIWDLSAGAREEVLYLDGASCPKAPRVLRLPVQARRCTLQSAWPEPVGRSH